MRVDVEIELRPAANRLTLPVSIIGLDLDNPIAVRLQHMDHTGAADPVAAKPVRMGGPRPATLRRRYTSSALSSIALAARGRDVRSAQTNAQLPVLVIGTSAATALPPR